MKTITALTQPVTSKVYGLATSTTHATYVTPTSWIGQRVVFEAIDAAMYIVFGTTSAVEADATAVSTADGSGNLTVAAKTGAYVPAGTAIEFMLDSTSTYFSIEAVSTGAWRGWMSDPA